MDDKDTKERSSVNASGVSRRTFIAQAVTTAGATAAAVMATSNGAAVAAEASSPSNVKPITIPEAFKTTTPSPNAGRGRGRGRGAAAAESSEEGAAAPEQKSGAQIFAELCKKEGLAALFSCPGNYTMVNALANIGIPCYSGRNEGSMTHAADGFCRVTGEIAACSGTEGPGFAMMLGAIATAHAARSPILVIASNMSVGAEDTEGGIQVLNQQPYTEPMRKYGKRITSVDRVHEYGGYAFRHLKTGVPRPVHLDFPSEAASRSIAVNEIDRYYDKEKYRTEAKPHPDPKAIKAAVELISKAERPILVSSNGVFYSKGWEALKKVAEKNGIPVAESGVVKGQIPHDSKYSANCSASAFRRADVVILVGQYCMPTARDFQFPPSAKYVRIDPCPEDIGRNLPVEVGIVSCEKAALEALADALPKNDRTAWLDQIAAAKKTFEEDNDKHYATGYGIKDAVHPAVIAKELQSFMYEGKIPKEQTTFVSGGYGIGRYVRRRMRGYRPGQILNGAYQFGNIGPDVGYTFGAAAAVRHGVGPQAPYKGAPVIGVTGDAGIGYTIMEMETASKYKMPMIIVVYNNNAWGTWSGYASNPLLLQMHLFQENLRYDLVAEAVGAHGEYVTTPDDFRPALERSYELAVKEGRPSLINCQARREFTQGPVQTPGAPGPGYTAYSH